jgi:choline dehydrogenase-like flavoprotein
VPYLISKRARVRIVVKISGEGVAVILASRRALLKTHYLRRLRRLGVSLDRATLRTLMVITPEGIARLDATRKHGRRCSAAVAHLRPALARGNVTLLTKSQVLKINMTNNSVSGVTFKHRGETRSIKANKEVILSGGAINSPHLLMLSGIGPEKHLKEHGIDVNVDLPGVGQNLQDHSCVILQYACKKSFPIHKVNQPHRKLATGIKWVFTKKGDWSFKYMGGWRTYQK